MAKLEFFGKIEKIGDVINIQTKNGNTLCKREVIIDGTTYDRYDGTPIENHVQFEFIGNKCSILDSYKVNDKVVISFSLSGFFYEKDGKQKNMTKVVGYDCRHFGKQADVQTQQPASSVTTPQQTSSANIQSNLFDKQAEENDLPF